MRGLEKSRPLSFLFLSRKKYIFYNEKEERNGMKDYLLGERLWAKYHRNLKAMISSSQTNW